MMIQGRSNLADKAQIVRFQQPLNEPKPGHRLISPRQKNQNNNHNALVNILEIKALPPILKKPGRKPKIVLSQREQDQVELTTRRELDPIKLIQETDMVHQVKMKLSEVDGAHAALQVYMPILIETYQKAESAGLINGWQDNITQEQQKLLSELPSWIYHGLKGAHGHLNDFLLQKKETQEENTCLENGVLYNSNILIKKVLSRFEYGTKQYFRLNFDQSISFDIHTNEPEFLRAFNNVIDLLMETVLKTENGKVEIFCRAGETQNTIIIRDTIPRTIEQKTDYLLNLYDRLENLPNHAGIFYTKDYMKSLNGSLSVKLLKPGQLEFMIKFPKV